MRRIGARLDALEARTPDASECHCPTVPRRSGWRVEDPDASDSERDDVTTCEVCGRERPTVALVYDVNFHQP